MPSRPPTTIILPTIRVTPVIDELAGQLGPADELLVVCDTPADPIASDAESLPEPARLIFAGEPERCSGKANAVAAGMEAAAHERIVWTDDDFHHPPTWLDDLHADYDRHGPTTEVPFFIGHDPLALLLEPLYALGATYGLTLLNKPWAGAVIFERGDLGASSADLDEARFLSELRRTVSDDGLLSLYLDVTPVERARRVDVGGTLGESLERHVRFMQIAWRFAPNAGVILPLSVFFLACCLLFPIQTALVSTVGIGVIYAKFGVRRWTAVLAYPALIVQFPLLLLAFTRRSFVWAGRRYRWTARFDVIVDT